MLLTVRLFAAALLLTAGHWVVAAELGKLIANPPQLTLTGAGARYTLLLDRQVAPDRLVDATSTAQFSSSAPQICRVSETGELTAVSDGSATITMEVAGQRVRTAVTVKDTLVPRAINFENDITPLLTRFACNYSGCHGKAEGQNGFKLSVFGFDPGADYNALVKETRGRRVFPAAPDRSLLLQKAAGVVPHGGGARLATDSREYELIRAWIATGLPIGSEADPKVTSIELTPGERVLEQQTAQRLRVVARYSDGREVDVTTLAKFQSNNDTVASVDESGLVSVAETPGQVAVMASFAGQVDVFLAMIPRREKIESYPKLPEANFIDRLVHERLRRLQILPSELCDDATFLRRATLDVIGTLPTADEARQFLSDRSPDRRARWVAALLDRGEYADYWALKWADLLRVERQALNHKGAHDYYEWIRDSFATNKPLDRFAAEVLTADGPLSETPPAHFYKVVTKPGDVASTLSQVFLGVRIACAECHHHPHDRWSQEDYFGMASYFQPLSRKPSPRGESLVAQGMSQAKHPRSGEIIEAHPLGAAIVESDAQGDRRGELAQWLTAPSNPWFARNIANRIWAHLMGRGIVEPVDDVRATNPPSHPELLDALADELVKNKYDVRSLIRTIMASNTYQRSSHPTDTNAGDEQNFSRALFKRLDAEVLMDAVCQTTGVPEKFQGVPSGSRAIQLWDSRVNHYFLRLFGRPLRATACTCERNVEPNVSQVLHLLNSPALQAKLSHRGGRLAQLVPAMTDNARLVDELYLTFFARHPSAEERQVAEQFMAQSGDRAQAAQDLAWSLMNTLEFVFNH